MSDEYGSQPLEHIERAQLPWRNERVTECGRLTNDVKSILTREQAIAKWKRLGAQRAAMTTCMTCAQTANRQETWEESPSAVMQRYAQHWRTPEVERLNRELRAIALLIDAHQYEFQELLDGLAATKSLAEKRAARQRGEP